MSTTVSGKLENLGQGNVSIGTFVRFYLRGAGGNQPRVNGTALIAPTLGNVYYFDFVPTASGVISGTLWSTRDSTGLLGGDIEVGGVTTAVWYGMVVYSNGKAGPETPIHAKNGATFDISNVTPITTNPVVTAPTGDSTYARLDGGNQPFTGAIQAPQFNHQRVIDGGTLYPNTGAGFQQAVTDCIADSLCSDVHAELLGSVTTTTITSLTKPMRLWLGAGTVITGTSDPVVCWSSAVEIRGVAGEGGLGTVSAIKSSAAGSRVLAPCNSTTRTISAVLDGIDLWNSNAASTAIILDMTNTSQTRINNSFIQQSAGTGDLVFVTITSGLDAFYNNFVGCKLFGGGGVGYHITNGANSQAIIGGKIDHVTDCLLVDGTGTQTNEIGVYGTVCESQSLSVIHTISNVVGVHWIGGRWESPAPATLFNISASSSQINVIGVSEFNTQTCGTTNSLVTIVGWVTGSPCITSGIDIFSPNNISGQAWAGQNSGVTSLFVNTANANNPLNISVDGTANGNGLGLLNTHAGGHNFLATPGAFNVTRLSIRDTTQSGQPAWSFQMTGTAAVEGIHTHANTATRTYNWPDSTGAVPITPNLAISATAPTIAAGGCGGSAAAIVTSNGTAAFELNVGTAPTSAGCTVTMPSATTGWNCDCSNLTSTSTTVFYCKQTGAVSQTSVVLQNFSDVAAATAFNGSDHLRVKCAAY